MKSRLTRILLIASCLLMPVFVTGVYEFPHGASRDFDVSAEVWSDDFNDYNADGWDFWGMNYSDPGPLPANYSVSEGMLRFQGVAHHWTIAMYNTTQAAGTWSFDLDVQDQERDHFYVSFISGYWDNDSIDWEDWYASAPYEYGIMPVTGTVLTWENEFVLYRRNPGGDLVGLARYSPPEIIGWHHIDITRDSDGNFDVYFNGTHQMAATSTAFTTTECFKIYSQGGPAIDSIVVDDTITITSTTTTSTTTTTTSTTTPTTATTTTDTPPPPDLLLLAVIGGGAVAVLVMIVLVRSKSRGLQ